MARDRSRARVAGGFFVLAAVVAGCGQSDSGGSATSSELPSTSQSTIAPSVGETAPPRPAPDLAPWQEIAITDAAGDTFTIGDLSGRPVFVENFATWCSNCREQLADTQKAASAAGDGAVFLALSVETELDASDMTDYANDNGFTDIRFAVMSPDLLGAMFDAYGNSALNPPSTPKIAVAADGRAGELVTGYESVEEILSSLGLS